MFLVLFFVWRQRRKDLENGERLGSLGQQVPKHAGGSILNGVEQGFACRPGHLDHVARAVDQVERGRRMHLRLVGQRACKAVASIVASCHADLVILGRTGGVVKDHEDCAHAWVLNLKARDVWRDERVVLVLRNGDVVPLVGGRQR